MIHFFPHYADDVSGTPFAAELRRLGVPHMFFSTTIDMRYRSMFGLVFRVYPRLLFHAVRLARASLTSRGKAMPDVCVVGTDVEALVFGLVRRLFRLKTKIVYETFIITPRESYLLRALHGLYYRTITSLIDMAICHSSVEAQSYREAFARAGCRFVAVPFGITLKGREAMMERHGAAAEDTGSAIVAAGRSGRDYPTLVEAIHGLPCRLHIISDIDPALARIEASPQVTILRDCFGLAYIEELARARFVVVPLAVDNISAGQMVVMQAKALGKALIVTRTATTVEYAEDGKDALLVDRHDVGQMRAAIRRLLEDDGLRSALGRNAALRFEEEHSTEAYVRKLVAALDTLKRPEAPATLA